MTDQMTEIRTAVVQAAPVLFDREATVRKVCQRKAHSSPTSISVK